MYPLKRSSKIGFSSVIFFDEDYEEAVKLAEELGVDAVELFLDYPQFDKSMKNIRNLQYHNIEYLVHLPIFDINFSSFKNRKKALKEIKAKLREITKYVPVRYATLHLGEKPLYNHKGFNKGLDRKILELERQAVKNTVYSLQELRTFCRGKGIKLNVENLDSHKKYGSDPNELISFSRYADGITYDVAHAYSLGYDIDHFLELIKDRINVVHCSDTVKGHDAHYPVGELDIPPEYYSKIRAEYFIIEPNPTDVDGLKLSVERLRQVL